MYPKGMSQELAARLYGSVVVSWAEDAFVFSPERSECKAWLARGIESVGGVGNRYDAPGHSWPPLSDVIRRGNEPEGVDARVFQWSDGSVFEQTT